MRKSNEFTLYEYGCIEDADVKDAILCNNEDMDESEITESMMWDYRDWMEETDKDEAYYDIEFVFEKGNASGLVFLGTAGRWFGHPGCGFTAENWDEAMSKLISDRLDRIWDDNGHLFVNHVHHDGTDSFEVRFLTEKGAEYLKRNGDEYDRLERVFKNSHYSHIPRVARAVYGYGKRVKK